MGCRRRWSLLLLLAGLSACGGDWEAATRIDPDWHRRSLEESHLTRWLAAAPTPAGLLNTAFDRHWQPVQPQPGDLAGQARALDMLVAGYRVTAKPAYLEQARRAADFLLAHFQDRQFGGWFEAVAVDGTVRNPGKGLRGHALVLSALAGLYRASGDERYLRASMETWAAIREHFAEDGGGFRSAMNRAFAEQVQGHGQEPLLRLFEALLALWDVSEAAEVRGAAEDLGNFVAYRLLQGTPDGGAYVPEGYDAGWKPLKPGRGGRIDIGHQFTWAYLLSVAAERGLNPVYGGVSERILKYALDHGYDRAEGGVLAVVSTSDQRKGGWQQAEALRAVMHHAVVRRRDDLWAFVTQLSDYVRAELVDEENGGWYPAPRSQCKRGGCPDRQPDGAPMVDLHVEALRLAALARQRR